MTLNPLQIRLRSLGTLAIVCLALTANASVRQGSVVSVSFSPSSLTGGGDAIGTVTLNGNAPHGGVAVKLSSNTASVVAPTSVTVPDGASSVTFQATTKPVASQVEATITAAEGSHSASGSLKVIPPVLTGAGLSPSTVFGGNSTTGTVTLNGPAPAAGMVVSLTSNIGAAIVPATVTVASGQSSAKFVVNTTPVSQVDFGQITATLNGLSANLIITISAPVLTGLSLSQSTVAGGKTTVATLTISSPAPSGGLSVAMSAGTTVAAFLNTVVIPAGKTSVTFTIVTIPLQGTVTDTITATFVSASVSATLTVTP